MVTQLNINDSIPSFEAKDHEGKVFTNTDLLGNFCVLYFYPKDDTPGCTIEACAFRDKMGKLKDLGIDRDVIVLGISPDGKDSHQKFISKYQLNYPLIVDEKKELCQLFHVLNEKGLERTTFLIDPKGKIIWLERPVKVEDHVERVLEALKEISTL